MDILRNAVLSAVPASATQLYSCPGGVKAKLDCLWCAHTDASTAHSVTITILHKVTSFTLYLVKALSLQPGESLDLVQNAIYLQPGDTIFVQGSSAGKFDVIASITEVDESARA